MMRHTTSESSLGSSSTAHGRAQGHRQGLETIAGRNRQKRAHTADCPSLESDQRTSKKIKQSDDKLCDRCVEIIVDTREIICEAARGRDIARVDESSEELEGSSCKFCRLLGSIKNAGTHGQNRRLCAFSADNIYARIRAPTLKKYKISSSVLLGFLTASDQSTKTQPSDFIGIVKSGEEGRNIAPRLIQRDKIDYDMIKAWISFCQSKHMRLCTPLASGKASALRVIDVDTRRILAAPESCEYVALSYVWGPSTPPDPRRTRNMPSVQFSRVVEDSFIVTRELGYKYLWVDKHCIDQNSANDKHEQIGAMHLVYGAAQVTIIAAAGEDANHGLPGIGSAQRVQQGFISVGNTTYIRTFPHASQTLRASRWATRGWTLQEGLLSRRRLIFTDQQVSFQCNGMHCSEAVHWPYEIMHASTSNMFPQNVPEAPFRLSLGRRYFNENRPFFNLLDITHEFTARTLSYPAKDALNAFLGILADFETRKAPIYHICGVPIIGRDGAWRIVLRWRHSRPCARLVEFPSWSWTGWSGPVSRGLHQKTSFRNMFRTGLERDKNNKTSDILPLTTFAKEHEKHKALSTNVRFLQIHAYVVDLQFVLVSWSCFSEAMRQAYYSERRPEERKADIAFRDGLYAKFPQRGYTMLSYFYVDDRDFDSQSLHEKSLLALLLEEDVSSNTTILIVLVPRSDHLERLGYVVSFSSYHMYPNNDLAYRTEDGRLSKVQPDIALDSNEPEQPQWKKSMREMEFRLG